MGAPKISDGIASKSEASACLGAKSCKGSRAYDWFRRKLYVDGVAGDVGNQPEAAARSRRQLCSVSGRSTLNGRTAAWPRRWKPRSGHSRAPAIDPSSSSQLVNFMLQSGR